MTEPTHLLSISVPLVLENDAHAADVTAVVTARVAYWIATTFPERAGDVHVEMTKMERTTEFP